MATGDETDETEEMRVTPRFLFDCPFCEGCTVIVGDTCDDRTMLLHTTPMCSTFEREDPAAFMVMARKRFHEVDPRLS